MSQINALNALKGAIQFRGQADWSWPVQSSLDRQIRTRCYSMQDRQHVINHIHKNFINSCRSLVPPIELSSWERDQLMCFSIGRHYGLSTPLIDFTDSPYIALFFAFAEASDAEYRTVIGLDPRGMFEAELIQYAPDEVGLTSRVVAQRGSFFFLPRHWTLDEAFEDYSNFTHSGTRARLIRYEFPNYLRDEVLHALYDFNITYSRLFPDIQGAALNTNLIKLQMHSNLWRGAEEMSTKGRDEN